MASLIVSAVRMESNLTITQCDHLCEEHQIQMLQVNQGQIHGTPYCPICRAENERETME